MRFNSTESAAGTPSDGPTVSPTRSHVREVTEGGTDYLVADVVAQQEGVYGYPDPAGGVRYEFVSGDALTANADAWDGTPLVLRHPKDGDDYVSVTNATDPDVVGAYRNVDPTQDGTALGGEVWIRQSDVGAYGGDLRAYVDALADGDYGEVSTGYEAGTIQRDPGTYNGESYEYVQRDLSPDHLALLPDERGNCSVADGCGVGRANEAPDEADDTPGFRTLSGRVHAASVRVGDKVVWGGDGDGTTYGIVRELRDHDDDLDTPPVAGVEVYRPADEVDAAGRSTRNGWAKTETMVERAPEALQRVDAFPQPGRVNDADGWFAHLGRRVADAVGLSPADRRNETEPDTQPTAADSDSPTDDLPSDEPAESGRDADPDSDPSDSMKDQEKIDDLVANHGFDRENLEPLAGEQCLQRIHENAKAAADDDESATDSPDETPDEPTTNDSPDGDDLDARIDEKVEARIDERVDERLNEQADSIADRVDEARANERNIDLVANSDAYPLDRDELEGMDADAVAKLADSVEETADADDDRINMAGLATGPSVDLTTNDDETDDAAPVGGAFSGDTGGDD